MTWEKDSCAFCLPSSCQDFEMAGPRSNDPHFRGRLVIGELRLATSLWLPCQAEFPKPAGSRLGIQLSLVRLLDPELLGSTFGCQVKVNTPDREGLVVEKVGHKFALMTLRC